MKTKIDKSKEATIGASNSITILNALDRLHSGRNLYNLDYCNIENANLSGADLSNISFKNANLKNCIL